jgi:large subunit ribosomal protein L2
MPKRLLQQRQGTGEGRFRSPKHRYIGASRVLDKDTYQIKELLRSPAHTAPVMRVEYNDGTESIVVAPEGVVEGETYQINPDGDLDEGDISELGDIPEGTTISNIEAQPGDGGCYVKASGAEARITNKDDDEVTVLLPSDQTKTFNAQCKAVIGRIAGGGRTEKPFLKAGKKHHIMEAQHRFYPRVSPTSMNAVSHPFGNSRSLRKSKAKPAPKNAPPGRRVGSIRPNQQGRKR